jgi:hypothetical protein
MLSLSHKTGSGTIGTSELSDMWQHRTRCSDRRNIKINKKKLKKNSVALVRKRTKPSDRRLSAKLVPTFAFKLCRVVSATDPHGR